MNKYNLQVHSDYSSTLIDYYWIPERDSIYESSNAHAINVYLAESGELLLPHDILTPGSHHQRKYHTAFPR